jgi:predicted PurR-regulated permease PerM
MLGFDRRTAKIAWTVSLVATGLFAIYNIRRTLLVFVLAIFFSYMVYPLVHWAERFMPQRRHTHVVATALVFVLLLLVLIGVGALAGPPIADQASRLAEQLPKLTQGENLLQRLPLPNWLAPYRDSIANFISQNLQSGTQFAVPLARQVGQTALQVAGNLIFVVLIPVLAFLLIKDASEMRDRYLAWADERRHASMWRTLIDDLDKLLGRYMRALVILALATVFSYAIAFTAAGVPYGLLLAVVAGVLEFIPVLGPLIAALLCLGVAVLSGYAHLLLIIGFIAIYRLFQDYMLNPYLMSGGVSISPLMVLVGLLAGEELGGIAGVFLSVPVLAAVKIAALRISQAERGRVLPVLAERGDQHGPALAPLPPPPPPPPAEAKAAAECVPEADAPPSTAAPKSTPSH